MKIRYAIILSSLCLGVLHGISLMVVSISAGAVLLRETFTGLQVIGAVLIIGGAMFGEMKKQRQ